MIPEFISAKYGNEGATPSCSLPVLRADPGSAADSFASSNRLVRSKAADWSQLIKHMLSLHLCPPSFFSPRLPPFPHLILLVWIAWAPRRTCLQTEWKRSSPPRVCIIDERRSDEAKFAEGACRATSCVMRPTCKRVLEGGESKWSFQLIIFWGGGVGHST